MRKIKRSKDSKVMIAGKQKGLSKQAILGIILAAIMVLSGVGFYFGSDSGTTFRYNGFKFTQNVETGGVTLDLDGTEVSFFDTPQAALAIEVETQSLALLKNTPQLYLTFDPNQEQLQAIDLVRFELGKALADFNIMAGNGVLTQETNQTPYVQYPIITCANATQYVPVLVVAFANTTSLRQNATGCVIMGGKTQSDLLRLRDRIVYSLYGVLP